MSPNVYDGQVPHVGTLTWVHFGDLHITHSGEQNYHDFLQLITHANANLAANVNFAVLPGDNVEDGTDEQFLLVQQAIDRLAIPLEILPGDHDAKNGGLTRYRRWLQPELWRSVVVNDYRCLFINVLDTDIQKGFGLSRNQLDWLEGQLVTGEQRGEPVVLFMHAYPSDIREGAATLQQLLRRHRVLFVDTGHTHYNEIANDGRTIYAATRSTGQIEEGPVGFSLTNLDHGVVSWKFKPLGQWPFVMITSPADLAFILDAAQPDQRVRGPVEVRANAWDGNGIVSATCRIDTGSWQPMSRMGAGPSWHCAWPARETTDGIHRVTVAAQSSNGETATDTISVEISASSRYQPKPRQPGDCTNAIGSYPEKGILGTQLGPNKNGRKW